jgi:hypothetical protein
MFAFLVLISLFAPPLRAQENEVIRLERRVTDLEGRIRELEGLLEECARAEKKRRNEYGWQNKQNWRKLEAGMSREQVRTLLGEPTKVIKGVKILWYYPNIYGGFVSFDLDGNLAGWNEP